MSQAVQLRAVSSPFSHAYLYPIHLLSQAVPASSLPSPEVMSRKPFGILLNLLESTLAGVLGSVGSKRLNGLLTRLEATLTERPGGGGSVLPSPSHLSGASDFAVSRGTREITPASSGLPNRGVR